MPGQDRTSARCNRGSCSSGSGDPSDPICQWAPCPRADPALGWPVSSPPPCPCRRSGLRCQSRREDSSRPPSPPSPRDRALASGSARPRWPGSVDPEVVLSPWVSERLWRAMSPTGHSASRCLPGSQSWRARRLNPGRQNPGLTSGSPPAPAHRFLRFLSGSRAGIPQPHQTALALLGRRSLGCQIERTPGQTRGARRKGRLADSVAPRWESLRRDALPRPDCEALVPTTLMTGWPS